LTGTCTIVIQWATELGVLSIEIITVGLHLQASGADGDTIRSESNAVIISGFPGVSQVKVDIWDDVLALTETVHGHGVMSGIEEQGNRLEIRSQSTEAEECFAEAMGIMHGCAIKVWKERQAAIRIGEEVHIIAEIPALAGGIPADITVGLRIETIAIAVEDTLFPAITCMMRAEAGSSNDRSAVTGDDETFGTNVTTANGFIQEAGPIDFEHGAISFLIDGEGG